MSNIKQNAAAYTVTIPAESLETLFWISDRGYDGRFMDLATYVDEPEADSGDVVFGMSEVAAWEFSEAVNDDFDAFLACCGDQSLSEALINLWNEIV